ncbi:MAG: hypothetical protein AAF571_08185 [Verrucomicrobiota bacterium]
MEIILFQPEAYLLKSSLQDIVRNYRADVEGLPEAVKKLWFSDHPAGDEEDYELWLEHLNDFRGGNSKLAERLIGELENIQNWPAVLSVSCSEADSLLTVVNDQRLYLAAVHEIGDLEKEMDEDWGKVIQISHKLALVQIQFLAGLMELMIAGLSGLEEL